VDDAALAGAFACDCTNSGHDFELVKGS
jgi:hypothetical protein